MSARIDALSPAERETRRVWLDGAAHVHFGVCGTCGRTRDIDGGPLLVARQSRRPNFECILCWEFPERKGRRP